MAKDANIDTIQIIISKKKEAYPQIFIIKENLKKENIVDMERYTVRKTSIKEAFSKGKLKDMEAYGL